MGRHVVSQTLVGSRGVTTSRAGAAAIVKTTCGECKRTVLMVDVGDGQRVAVDPELIAVAVSRGKSQGGGQRVHARRVHGELCDRYRDEAERAARKERWTPPPMPINKYRMIDNTKRARATARRGSRTKGL